MTTKSKGFSMWKIHLMHLVATCVVIIPQTNWKSGSIRQESKSLFCWFNFQIVGVLDNPIPLISPLFSGFFGALFRLSAHIERFSVSQMMDFFSHN